MSEDVERLRRLAIAVISQAFLDANLFPKQRAKLVSKAKWAAQWRELWCSLLNKDPEVLRERAEKVLSSLNDRLLFEGGIRQMVKEVLNEQSEDN